MKIRRILAVLLAFVMALGTTAAFAADKFTDVPEDAYYADAVAWAAEQKITTGRGNGIFDPGASVTRAEAVTFLWRMAGEPAPTQTETFADVEADANSFWYKTAVQWAVEKGITNGTGNGNFSPKVTCSRGMILTMIYRMEGCPFDEPAKAVVPENSEDWTLEDFGNSIIQAFIEVFRSADGFSDVKAGEWYEMPIIWAMFNSVLDENQVDSTAMTVKPDAPCPRGEMVYFLYRTNEYEKALKAAEPEEREPVETGAVPETVVLEKDGVKITLTGIENDPSGDAVLTFTVVNGSGKNLAVDTGSLYVNTYAVSTSAYIPEEQDGITFYSSVIVAPGETKAFYVCLNELREKGVTAVYELELQFNAFEVNEIKDGYEYTDFAYGDPVSVRTSLYNAGVSYDQEGAVLYDRDGVKVLACKAVNSSYAGPQLCIYAYNGSSETVSLALAELKLDGVKYEASFGMDVAPGKRCVEPVYIDLDYENPPVVKEAEITLQLLDQSTWEPSVTFDPVKVPFTA